jgi:hypothetical protein
MIKHVLLAAGFSVALASAGLAAPLPATQQVKQGVTSDLVQVKKRGRKYHGRHYRHRHYRHYRHYRPRRYYRHHHHRHYRGRYWYGGRYWRHRYYYRPRYWWGCIRVGPIWYCP